MPSVDEAVGELKSLLRVGPKEAVIVHRAREKRIDRTEAVNKAAELAVRERAIHTNNKHSQCYIHRSVISLKSVDHLVRIGDTQFMQFGVCGPLCGGTSS